MSENINEPITPYRELEAIILTDDKKLESILKSNRFIMLFCFILVIVALILSLTNLLTLSLRKPSNNYFASTADGRIIQLTPLSQPLMSLNSVENFAQSAINKTFTFDYVNYKNQITQNAQSFTQSAFTDIKNELQNNNGLVSEAVKNNWVVTTQVMSAPQVVTQGHVGESGTYGWHLIYPVMMTFQNETAVSSARYTADVVIIRVSEKEYPSGIAIKSLILTPYRD